MTAMRNARHDKHVGADPDRLPFPGPAMCIVWAPPHMGTRSAWLAHELGIDDVRYIAPTNRRGLLAAPMKYPRQAITTLRALNSARPRVVLVQSPPSFAAWTAWLYAVATRSALVIDPHSDAFERAIWTRPRWLNAIVARRSATVIVTNSHWADLVRSWGANATVVPAIPTTFEIGPPPPLAPGFNVAVVNTWAPDEPLAAVAAAAALVPEATFHVTGRDDLAAGLGTHPSNVRFTGFLAEPTYHGLLASSQAVVCLTTRNHTMQNGACEALSHGTPVITSNWPVLRAFFSSGAVHVDPSPEAIAAGVRRVMADHDSYVAGIRSLRELRRREWLEHRDTLVALAVDQLARLRS